MKIYSKGLDSYNLHCDGWTFVMASNSNSFKSLFDKGALMLDDFPIETTTLPDTSKTSTTPLQGADLATTVDWANGEVHHCSMPSQGLHYILYRCCVSQTGVGENGR